jgi:hypothetical protein
MHAACQSFGRRKVEQFQGYTFDQETAPASRRLLYVSCIRLRVCVSTGFGLRNANDARTAPMCTALPSVSRPHTTSPAWRMRRQESRVENSAASVDIWTDGSDVFHMYEDLPQNNFLWIQLHRRAAHLTHLWHCECFQSIEGEKHNEQRKQQARYSEPAR